MGIRFLAVKQGWRSKRNFVLIVAALIVLAALYRFSLDYVLTLFAFLFFVMVPGVCISVWVFRGKGDLLENTALAFGCGITFNAVFFFIRGLVRFPAHYSSTAYLFSGIILLVLLVTVSYRNTRRSLRHWFDMGETALIPLSCVVLLCVVLLFNENTLLLTSDSLVYLPQIADWQRHGEFGVDLTTDFITLLGRTRLYRMVIQPFLLDVTGIDPSVNYNIMVSIVGFCFASSFYFFLKRIWDNTLFVNIGIVLFLCHFGGFWFNFIHSNYSWFVAWSLYFISMALILDYFSSSDRKGLIVAIVMASITGLFHGAFLLMTALSALSFLGCIIVLSKKARKWLQYSAICIAGIVFIGTIITYGIDVLWVRLPILDQMGVYRMDIQLRGHTKAFGYGYIINPVSGPALFSGLWGLLSIAFLPVIARNRHRLKRNGALFLISNTIFPLAVLFNPLLVSVMLPLVTSDGVERLIFALPYIPIVAVTVTLFIQKWQENPEHAGTRLKAIGIVSLVLLAGSPVFIYRMLLLMPYDWGYKAQPFLQRITGLPTGPFRYNHPALIRAMEFVRNRVEPEALFLTDPITAELFPVLVKNPVLETWRDYLLGKRVVSSKSMKALGPDLDVAETAVLLMKKHVEFVLINNSWNPRTRTQYFGTSSDNKSVVFDVQKFKEHPELFRLIFEDQDIFVFRFLSEGVEVDFKNEAVLQTFPLLLLGPSEEDAKER